MRFLGNFYIISVLTFLSTNAVFCLGFKDLLNEISKKELRIRRDDSQVLESELNSAILNRLVRSDRNNTRLKEVSPSFAEMDSDSSLRSGFDASSTVHGDGTGDKTEDDSLLGSTSDYVLIAMIVAMMFCMTLCCLCLFCRSSSRLTICGINFELNDRRNSFEEGENQSEIHDVVPLTPTTAGDFNNRLPDIENMLRGDAPPPMYNEIVKKAEAKDCQAKAEEGKRRSGKFKRKSNSDRASETSSTRSNGGRRSSGGRNSWRFSGRGIFASFRSKSSMLRSRRSDSAIQCPTVREGVVLSCHSDDLTLPPTIEEVEAVRPRAEHREDTTVETIDEVTKANNESQGNKVFVYDVHELRPEEDDDVFL